MKVREVDLHSNMDRLKLCAEKLKVATSCIYIPIWID